MHTRNTVSKTTDHFVVLMVLKPTYTQSQNPNGSWKIREFLWQASDLRALKPLRCDSEKDRMLPEDKAVPRDFHKAVHGRSLLLPAFPLSRTQLIFAL